MAPAVWSTCCRSDRGPALRARHRARPLSRVNGRPESARAGWSERLHRTPERAVVLRIADSGVGPISLIQRRHRPEADTQPRGAAARQARARRTCRYGGDASYGDDGWRSGWQCVVDTSIPQRSISILHTEGPVDVKSLVALPIVARVVEVSVRWKPHCNACSIVLAEAPFAFPAIA